MTSGSVMVIGIMFGIIVAAVALVLRNRNKVCCGRRACSP